ETVLSTAAKLFFVGTSNPRINAARVADRVIAGGHTVPIDKIITRYERSMANLSVTIRLANRIYVFDNSIDGVEAKLCLRTQDGLLRKIYADLPEWVSDLERSIERHRDFVD